jgi:transposase
MLKCKNCGSGRAVKNGKVRGKQRYRCKECSYNFVEGDARTNDKIAAKKAMLILLYSLGKASFNLLARLFDTWPSQVYRWVVQEGLSLPEQEVSGEIKEMEFDEMWHFVQEKKTNFGSSRPLIVAAGEPWPGCSAIVILRPSDGFMRK